MLIFLIGAPCVFGEDLKIPSWIKNNALWWSEGQIGDSDFIKGIQYLIQNGIMKIPTSNVNVTKSNVIPTWIKNNAAWWANGTITDNDFVSGIQYLIQSGIINVRVDQNASSNYDQCNKFTTAAEKETCQNEIELDNKIKNDIAVSTPFVFGPITFYYVGNEIVQTEDSKTILTIHFVVEDSGSSQNVVMSCASPDSCNYALSDGQNEIQYATNTLEYGSQTLLPNTPKLLDWTFYTGLDYGTKNYSFLVKEPWGSGSIPLNLH